MGDSRRTLSVVIPVYRESDRINRLIEHVRRLDRGGDCEIIVVDGDPGCSTIAVVGDDRVITLCSKKGRARQMNAGAARARGDVLLFLHADTYLPEGAIDLVSEAMADSRYVAGAFGFSFDSTKRTLRLVSELVTIHSRLMRAPLGDHAIFVRRDYFAAIGGYRDIPILEDLEFVRRIKRRGDRVKILAARTRTSPRRLEREGTFYCLARNVSLVLLYSMGASPERLKRYYPDGCKEVD
jgi:rSAM/selenodomain-associated transferase 2